MRVSSSNHVPEQGLLTSTSSGLQGDFPLGSSEYYLDLQETRGEYGNALIETSHKENISTFELANYSRNFLNFFYDQRNSDLFSEEEFLRDRDFEFEKNIPIDAEYQHTQQEEEHTNPLTPFLFMNEEKEKSASPVQFEKNHHSGEIIKNGVDSEEPSKKRNQNLALRNIKLNMGTGLLQFIEFKRRNAHRTKNMKKFKQFDGLFDWVRDNQGEFRCFDGWKKMYCNSSFGTLLRKLAIAFFSGKFVLNYITFSKIKKEYKTMYKSKVSSFLQGAKFPLKFNPYEF